MKIEIECQRCFSIFTKEGRGCTRAKFCDTCKPIHRKEQAKLASAKSHAKKQVAQGFVVPEPDELIFYGYKNPLRRLKPEEGYGYDGVVLYSKDAEKIQCHVCGKLFKNVGSHAKFAHKLSAEQYKKKFNLSQKTALVGEKTRVALIQAHNTIPSFSQRGKTPKQIKVHMKKMSKKANKKGSRGWSLEKRNETGMCPQQLVAKVKRLGRKLGRRPNAKDYVKEYGSYQSIITVFGTWNEAIRLAGFTTYTAERSISTDPKYLLEQMKSFYDKHGRTPRHSDMKRGLVPSHQTYWKVFGSVNKARVLAGVPALIPVGGKWEEVIIPKKDQKRYQKELEKMY